VAGKQIIVATSTPVGVPVQLWLVVNRFTPVTNYLVMRGGVALDLSDVLKQGDVVIVAPSHLRPKLSPEELEFEANLGLHSIEMDEDLDVFEFLEPKMKSGYPGPKTRKSLFEHDDFIPPEIEGAKEDFERVTWRIDYLVEKDGKTPCKTHKFIYREGTAILNLYHPDVRNLVRISKVDSKLAGHWAVAMCLTENNQILPHLNSQTREGILMVDAMTKV